jgi:S-DNA-T family DNA segregation ATPase FtsK/SpoIIIE
MANKPWQLPSIDKIFDEAQPATIAPNVLRQKRIIESTLAAFGFEAQIQQVQQGPQATLYSLSPAADVQLSRLKGLETDLAVALSGAAVQITTPTARHPFLSILVPHLEGHNIISLRRVLESAAFQQHSGKLKIGLGIDVVDQPVIIDLTELPHLLIGGTTGSGKSACLHAIVASLLCAYPPNALQLLMIDPLAVELRDYQDLPHLFAPVVTRSSQALDTLGTVDKVIDRRYRIFSDHQARNIESYNRQLIQADKDPIPHIVVVIDNVFDLLLASASEVEQTITRMAQRARGAGIHLILATPRAHTDALSGVIKANFPGRIALRVMGPAESRLILDEVGAEELTGPGDMLYKAPNTNALQRIQGAYVSEAERRRLVEFWRA